MASLRVRCVSGGHKDAVQEKEVLLGDAGGLECVAKFCYLGDMLIVVVAL